MSCTRILTFFVLACLIVSCTTTNGPTETSENDASTSLPDLAPPQDGAPATIPCGNGTCPSAAYTCCQGNKDAPPECCLSGYNACYNGGGGFTGWPVYNGCHVQKCLAAKPKHCPGGTRGTCCLEHETCGESFGIAFCEDKACPDDRKCNGGKLCCSKAGICKPFKNVQVCDESCDQPGIVKCSLEGTHYGTEQTMHICCPKDSCRHHPDGWPFCLNEVY